MKNKQEDSAIETASQPYNILELYNTTGSLSQYIVYNFLASFVQYERSLTWLSMRL